MANINEIAVNNLTEEAPALINRVNTFIGQHEEAKANLENAISRSKEYAESMSYSVKELEDQIAKRESDGFEAEETNRAAQNAEQSFESYGEDLAEFSGRTLTHSLIESMEEKVEAQVERPYKELEAAVDSEEHDRSRRVQDQMDDIMDVKAGIEKAVDTLASQVPEQPTVLMGEVDQFSEGTSKQFGRQATTSSEGQAVIQETDRALNLYREGLADTENLQFDQLEEGSTTLERAVQLAEDWRASWND